MPSLRRTQPVAPWLATRWQAMRSAGHRGRDALMQAALVVSLLGLVTVCATLLGAATHNPFIYFRF